MTVLGVLGDAVQIVLSGTTGVGSMLSGLLNTGYNIYSGNRQYEANRADTQWNQQLQERQYQDSLNQQRYENVDERAGVSGQTQPAEIQQRYHKPEAEHRTGRVEPEKVQCSAESKPRWQHGGRQ